jgi:hypothetical protein
MQELSEQQELSKANQELLLFNRATKLNPTNNKNLAEFNDELRKELSD